MINCIKYIERLSLNCDRKKGQGAGSTESENWKNMEFKNKKL